MSIECMTRVWKQSSLKGSSLLLMLAIADFADDNGVAWPGTETLSKKIRMSKRQVHRLVDLAEKAKELIVIRRRNRGNWYVIAIDLTDKQAKNAAQRVAGYTGISISAKMSHCRKTTSDKKGSLSDISTDTSDIQGSLSDIAMSHDPSIDPLVDPSIDPSVLSPPKESPSARQSRRQEKFGVGPLDAMVKHAERQAQRDNGRPKGWARISQPVWEICQAVAEQYPCRMPVLKPTHNDGTKEMVLQNIDKWAGGATLILESFNDDGQAAIDAVRAYRREFDGGFTVAGPQSLVNVLPSFVVKGEKRNPRRDGGTWSQDELATARQASLAETPIDAAAFLGGEG